jgi:hypothetical protein
MLTTLKMNVNILSVIYSYHITYVFMLLKLVKNYQWLKF